MLLDATLFGDAFLGDRDPLSGIVRDLAARSQGVRGADLSFSYDVASPSDHELGVVVDGELITVVTSDQAHASIGNLSEGIHTVQIVPHVPGSPWPELHGDLLGQRAYLRWTRCADSGVTAYRIYWDQGTGGAQTLLATVSNVSAQGQYLKCGNGRISIFGAYTGTADINDTLTITIVDNSFTAVLDGTSIEGTFEAGQSIALMNGLWVTFHDTSDLYADGVLTIPVGPATEYLSPVLAPGSYVFSVTAVKGSGNESDPLLSETVVIVELPPEVNAVASWDDGVIFTVPAVTADTVRIYSNYAAATSSYEDHVIFDAPLVSGAPRGTLSAGLLPDGVLRYCSRAVVGGIEREDASISTLTLPPTPADLGVQLAKPINLKATAGAAGSIVVEWACNLQAGSDVKYFDISINGTWRNVPIDALSGLGDPVARYKVTLTGPYAAPVAIKVRSSSDNVWSHTLDSAAVTVTPDPNSPEFSGSVIAGAQ